MSRRETADTTVVASRRRLLELVSGATVAGLAGCGGDGGRTDTPATETGANTPTATPTDALTDTPTATPVTEPPPWDPGVVRTMSFNVRYDNPDDEPPWPDRRERVVGAIRDVEPDVVGLQEALPHQFSYVREHLEGYEWYGIGRRGEDDGEHTPVGWRADRFEAVERGTFWLSEAPDEPGSVSWNADLPRIASWVELVERATGVRFRAYSTHFSHVSGMARQNSSALIRERVEEQLVDGRMVVVLGDFNFVPDSESHTELTRSGLVDARRVAESVEGPAGTFQGFAGQPGDRIDYVFLPTSVAVERFRTLPTAEPVRSDHLPVVADVDRDAVESAFG